MKYADRGPRLMPGGVDEVLMARQVQVVADGGCDAMVSVLKTRVGLVLRRNDLPIVLWN